jgi:hypothetical protein
MKKFFLLLMVAAMCLTLAACGNKEADIRDALQGSWVAEWTAMGKSLNRYYTFKGDKYTTGGEAAFGPVSTKTGTFTVEDSVIKLTPDDGSEPSTLDYTYNEKNGTIILWWNSDIQFERGKVNVSY